MLVARHAALNELKLNSATVEEGVLLSRLVAYCSKLVFTHFSYLSLFTLAELLTTGVCLPTQRMPVVATERSSK